MQNNALRIDAILAKDLYAFYCDYAEHPEGQQVSPISESRALAQSKNPCAEDSDVGLLVAYVGSKCVGYHGVLPGRLRTRDGTAKIYWSTASYVLPEFRKRMVAVQLIRKLTSLKKDIVATYFNRPMADLFIGLHFQEIPALQYINMRLEGLDLVAYPFHRFYRLQKRWPFLRKTAEFALRLSRRWCYPPLRTAYYRNLTQLSEEALETVDWRAAPPGALLSPEDFGPPNPGANFERDADVINWMVQFPWIREQCEVAYPPYFFSESYELFRYFTLTIHGPDLKPRGFVVLSRAIERDRSKLKVLDFRCPQSEYKNVFWLVCKHAAQCQVDEIDLPLELELYAASLPFPSLVMKRLRRRYLCYPSAKDSPLATVLQDLKLQLTDGDSPFT